VVLCLVRTVAVTCTQRTLSPRAFRTERTQLTEKGTRIMGQQVSHEFSLRLVTKTENVRGRTD